MARHGDHLGADGNGEVIASGAYFDLGHRAKTAEFPNFHATSPFIDAIKNNARSAGASWLDELTRAHLADCQTVGKELWPMRLKGKGASCMDVPVRPLGAHCSSPKDIQESFKADPAEAIPSGNRIRFSEPGKREDGGKLFVIRFAALTVTTFGMARAVIKAADALGWANLPRLKSPCRSARPCQNPVKLPHLFPTAPTAARTAP